MTALRRAVLIQSLLWGREYFISFEKKPEKSPKGQTLLSGGK